MFKTVGSYMPAPPPELQPPVMWGDEQHVRSLFAQTGGELSFERQADDGTFRAGAGYLVSIVALPG